MDATIIIDTIIAQREERATMKEVALRAKLMELTERCCKGSDWLSKNEGHPDYAHQKERLDRLWEQEGKLYELIQQFRFPFRILNVALEPGTQYEGRDEVLVVPDLHDRGLYDDVSEVLLPWDFIFFMAEKEGLL